MEFVVFLLAIWLFFLVAQYVVYLRLLTVSRLRTADAAICQASDIPEIERDQLHDSMQRLQRLGFEFSHFERRNDVFAAVKQARWIAILREAASQTYAEVSASFLPDAGSPVRVDFISLFPHTSVYTFNGLAHGFVEGFERMRCFDIQSNDLETRWRGHLEKLKELQTQQSLGDPLILDATGYKERLCGDDRGYFEYLSAQRLAHRDGEFFRLTRRVAFKLAARVLIGDNRFRKFRAAQVQSAIVKPNYLPHAELNAYMRQQQIRASAQWSGWGKALLFAVSAIGFALLFGVAWSPRLVFVLIPVLLFHELGHILAMRLFGYRDLQILFIPLGAAALGVKDDSTVMQKVLVSFAGPVPGLIVALGIVLAVPGWQHTEWLAEFVWMLAIINYLNLLPFMPLDGGQVVNAALFDRFPRAQIVFHSLSVALFAGGAWLLQDPILGVLALFIGIALLTQFRDPGLLRQLLDTEIDRTSAETIAANVFQTMKDKAWIFEQKLQTAQRLIPRLTHRPARFWEIACGLSIYVFVLIIPLYVVAQRSGLWSAVDYDYAALESESALVNADAIRNSRYSLDYWLIKLAEIKDPRQRYDTIVEALSVLMQDEAQEEFLQLIDEGIALAHQHNWINEASYAELLAKRIDAVVYLTNGQKRAAADLALLEQALPESDPKLAETLLNLGNASGDVEILKRALSIYQSHGNQDGAYNTTSALATALEQKGDQAEAEAYLRKLMEYDDKPWRRGQSLQMLAEYLIRTDRLPEAMTNFQAALGAGDDQGSRWHLIQSVGWVALLHGQLDLAHQWFERGRQARIEERAQLDDSMGFFAKLFIGKQLKAITSAQFSDHEPWMVLALKRDDHASLHERVRAIKQALQDNPYFSFDRYLDERKRVATQDHGVYQRALFVRQAEAVVAALEASEKSLAGSDPLAEKPAAVESSDHRYGRH